MTLRRSTFILAIVVAMAAAALTTVLVSAGTPGVTTASAGPVTRVQVARSRAITEAGNAWKTVAGSQVRVTVPEGRRALIIATWTAETACFEHDTTGADHRCSARILIGSAEGHPQSGLDFGIHQFAQNATTNDVYGHAMQRSATKGPGTHMVKVQIRSNAGPVGMQVDDWHLTVESFRA